MNVSIKPICVDKETAAAMLGISVANFEREVRGERIPPARQVSPRRVGWLLRELEEYAEKLPVSNILPPANTGAKKPRRPLVVE